MLFNRSPKKRFRKNSNKKKKLSLRKNKSPACEDYFSTTNLSSLPQSSIDIHNETSSSSDYVMNSSASDESTDEMEYENDFFDDDASSGDKPLTAPYSPLKDNTIENILKQLELNGFQKHYGSPQGGSFSVKIVKTWACRIAKFLSYTYTMVHDDQTLLPEDVNKWTSQIINKYYDKIFPKYVYYLGTMLQQQPTTISTYLAEIKKFIHWFVYFRGTRNVEEEIPTTLFHIDSIIKNLCTIERRRERKRRSDAPDINDLIDKRELPEGGLKELQEAVEKDLDWFDNLRKSRGMLEEKTYKRFMNMLYSALYVYSPQGRISAIEDLKLIQVNDLKTDGYAMSTRFKTNASFGYQPVTTAKVSKMLLEFYINNLRPEIVRKREDDSDDYDPSLLNYDNSPLFLNFDRSKAIRIGEKV
jgi:hypothetical protein